MKTIFVFNEMKILVIVLFQVAFFDLKVARLNKRQFLSYKESGIKKNRNHPHFHENNDINDKLNPNYKYRVNYSDSFYMNNVSGILD